MVLYEYVCSDCGASFELRRAMGDADTDIVCPDGHTDVRRRLSVLASVGTTTGAGRPEPSMGGCCGGACGCGH